MDPSTHAFAERREATTYTVLQRVLQNHCTTHALSLLAALTTAVLLLVATCLQLCEAAGVEEGTLLQQTLAGLKQRVRTRPARVPLPCWPSQTTRIRRISGCATRRRHSVGCSPRCWARPRRPTSSRRRAVGGSRAPS